MKFCKDCRWFDQSTPGKLRCGHPSSLYPPDPTEISLVTGKPVIREALLCASVRIGLEPQHCGPNGKHWEPGEIGFGP
jgi:hypothetical protein